MDHFPPRAFLVGAQKCGTTALAALLGHHPAIVASNPKEPDFFSWNWQRGFAWYRTCFPDAASRETGRILLDSSPSYSMAAMDANGMPDETIPQRIHAASPDAKFIYIVRNPAERCYSSYWHEVRAGRERLGLRAAIEGFPYYIDPSLYHRQVGNFLRYFPVDRFLFLHLDDLGANPTAVVQRCWQFLGVDPTQPVPLHGRKWNEGFVYNRHGKLLRDNAGEARLKAVSGFLGRTVPVRFHGSLKRLLQRPMPVLTAADRAWLVACLQADAGAFTAMTGIAVLPPAGECEDYSAHATTRAALPRHV